MLIPMVIDGCISEPGEEVRWFQSRTKLRDLDKSICTLFDPLALAHFSNVKQRSVIKTFNPRQIQDMPDARHFPLALFERLGVKCYMTTSGYYDRRQQITDFPNGKCRVSTNERVSNDFMFKVYGENLHQQYTETMSKGIPPNELGYVVTGYLPSGSEVEVCDSFLQEDFALLCITKKVESGNIFRRGWVKVELKRDEWER